MIEPVTEPGIATIVAARIAAGHDGLAEIAVEVRYSNGATRSMSLPYEAVADALDASSIASLDDLVGQPWTTLIPPPALEPTLEGAT